MYIRKMYECHAQVSRTFRQYHVDSYLNFIFNKFWSHDMYFPAKNKPAGESRDEYK